MGCIGMEKLLGQLQPGESGMIKSVGAENPRVKRRLVDMGITPMTEIEVRRIAPLGDPIEVSLRGYALSLRREDALQITLFSEEEAVACREKEAALQKEFASRAGRALGDHAADTDLDAHKQAERLIIAVIQIRIVCTVRSIEESISSLLGIFIAFQVRIVIHDKAVESSVACILLQTFLCNLQ